MTPLLCMVEDYKGGANKATAGSKAYAQELGLTKLGNFRFGLFSRAIISRATPVEASTRTEFQTWISKNAGSEVETFDVDCEE